MQWNTCSNMLLPQFSILCKWKKNTCPEGWHCLRIFPSCLTSPFHVTSSHIISDNSRRTPVTFTLFYLSVDNLFTDTLYYLLSEQIGPGRWPHLQWGKRGWIRVLYLISDGLKSVCVSFLESVSFFILSA